MIEQSGHAAYLTTARAKQALDIATPMIQALFDSNMTSQNFVHVVILNPRGSIAAERSFGKAEPEKGPEFEERCRKIARSKAQIHFREGLPSRLVQTRRPHALLCGDTVHGGSFDHEGLIVAASGVQGYYDETISGIVAAVAWGLCQQAQEKFMADRGSAYMYERPVPIA